MSSRSDSSRRQIDYTPLDGIAAAVRNPKGHDVDGIASSIARFGFVGPVVPDERTGRLVAGHGRILALQAMRDAGQSPPAGVRLADDGTWLAPVLVGWSSRSDAEADAFLVADNEWTIRGSWDDAQLGDLLDDIAAADPDLLAVTGFTADDVLALVAADRATGRGDEDEDDEEIPEPPADPVTRPGDVWQLGRHRLICGDCRDPATFATLLDGVAVNLAFTSPPYAQRRVYDPSSGFRPVPPDEYVEWFAPVQANVRSVLAPDGSWFVNIKEHSDGGQRVLYVKDLTVAHVRQWGWLFVDEYCWVDKANGVPGTWPNRFKNAWEPIFHFSTDPAIKFNPAANAVASTDAFEYSRDNGRLPTTTFPSGSGIERRDGMALPSNVVSIAAAGDQSHPAQFPVPLPAWFIRAYTDPGDTVLDPFAGSGSTLVAADREDRTGYGIEISPGYCDVICHRLQQQTGIMPTRDGEAHDFGGEP